jgi:hypothetical protein
LIAPGRDVTSLARRQGKGLLRTEGTLAAEKSAGVDALAAEAARARGCENGLETAEAVLRAGLLRLGGAMLRGGAVRRSRPPRSLADCGHSRKAVFAGYWGKVIDTVLGPAALRHPRGTRPLLPALRALVRAGGPEESRRRCGRFGQ